MAVKKYDTIYDLIRARGEHNGEAIAIVSAGRGPLNYRQLLYQVDRTIELLKLSGITCRDRIAIVLPAGPELAAAFLAISSVATSIPLNPACRENEFELYLSDLRPRAVIVQAGMSGAAVAVAKKHGIPIIELLPQAELAAGTFTLRENDPSLNCDFGLPQRDDIALILHTSGTTARPKMVPLTHTNLLASADNIAATLGLCELDRCLNVMPFFHIHGLVGGLLSSIMAGASVICTSGFDVEQFFPWLDAFRPTWYTAVPTIHHAVLARAQTAPATIRKHSLRFIRSSSSALPPQVMLGLEDILQVPVIEAYGMTEAAHQVASNPLPPGQRKVGSVGLKAGPEVAIMDEAGNLLSAGKIGEIVIRGDNVMHGYENNSDANASAFTRGWFRTGDQGYIDEDGYLFITGRLKELINRGGEKIAPREVEEVILRHPAVAEVIAFAMPHATLGEDVAAAVVLKTNCTVTERELQSFVAKHVMELKIPKRLLFVDEIPKSASGKPNRVGLAEKFAALCSEPPICEFVPPQTQVEKALATIWSEVLRVESIDIRDNFFQLGGDSIRATQVISRIRESLQTELPILSFFETPTLAGMAKKVEFLQKAKSIPGLSLPVGKQEINDTVFSFLVELQRGKNGKPILFFPGGEGGDSEFFYLMRLARNMRSDYQFYGFRARGMDGVSEPHASVEEMVRDYIVEIEKLQPEGPYFLIGECIGGAAAFEAARQLKEKGQTIAVLILLDSPCPKDEAVPFSPPQPQGASSTSPSEPMGQLGNTFNPHGHISRVGKVYSYNLRRYKAKPYNGEIKLIVNEEWFQRAPALGWRNLANGVESHVVSGNHSTYIDVGEHAKAVAQQLTKWLDEARGEDGNGWNLDPANEPLESTETPAFLTERLEKAKQDLAALIPKGARFILVDQDEWGSDILADRSAIPFLEHDGQYYGVPSDDETAIREFERLRRTGAKFVAFGWPAFWWLDYYRGFGRYLYSKFRCVLKNDRLVAFDLSL